ncbi:hypothetical protein BOX15_Mlig027414g1, partial [Macrostomum lignano]
VILMARLKFLLLEAAALLLLLTACCIAQQPPQAVPPSSEQAAAQQPPPTQHHQPPPEHNQPPPAHQQPPPDYQQPLPVHQQQPPVHQQPPPVHQQQPPVHQQQPPVHQQPPPVHQQQPPVQQQPPPAHQQQPPVHQQQPPVQQQPPPVHQQQPPVQQQPPPVQQQPPPVHQQQPPVQQQPPPVHQQQPPVQQQPPPVHQQPPEQQQQQQYQPPPEHHQPPHPETQESLSTHHRQPPPPRDSRDRPDDGHQGGKRVPSVLLPSEPNEFDMRSISFVYRLPSRGKQCFYHKASSNFTFEYQVTSGGSLDIDVFINSPGGKLAFDRRGKAYGEASFAFDPAKSTADMRLPAYMICLDNRYSSWHDKLVYFNIDVEQGREGLRPGADQLSEGLRTSLREMELSWEEFYKSTDKVEDHLLRTIYLLSKSRNNEARDRMMMDANNARVSTWSIFQLVVMLFVSGIQVMMIRSLFDDKSRLHRVWKAGKS